MGPSQQNTAGISLRWKAFLLLLTVLVMVHSGLGYIAYLILHEQSDQQSAENFARSRAMLRALIDKAGHDASEQAQAIAAAASAEELPTLGKRFFKFTAVRYYDAHDQVLAEWTLAQSRTDSQDLARERLAVAETSRTAKPQLDVDCHGSCLLRAVVPAFERTGRRVVVAAAYPLDEVLQDFQNVTQADVALLVHEAEGGQALLWGRRLVAATDTGRVRPLLADITGPEPPGTDAQVFNTGGHVIMAALQPLPSSASAPVEALLLIDQTRRLSAIAADAGNYAIVTLFGLVLATAAIFILLTPSLRRMGQITQGLPLLALQRFAEAKALFVRAARQSSPGDEIDRLNQSALTLADRLEGLMGVEAASEAKSQFLAAMSHEIRTPINGLMGLLELHEGTPLSDSQRESVRIMRDSAMTLLAVVDDILDFSKIQAGQLQVDPVPMSLREAVEGALETLAATASSKGLRLVCYVQPGLPRKVRADPVRLRQVLLNLCSNAIKFTAQGRVTVELTAADAATEPVRVRCTVRDTGIGIAPEAQARIFKPFQQAEVSISRRYGGTGLGLSISHGLVERMGGAMGFTSEAGVGSEFWFELDCPVVDAAAPEPATLEGVKLRLDVADTDERAKLQSYLASAGAQVSEAATGWQVRIEDKLHSGVLLTAVAGEQRALGRPVRYTLLVRELARLCGRAPEVLAAPVPAPVPRMVGRVLVAEDHPTNRRVIREQLERLGFDADIVEDGAQALERLGLASYRLLVTDLHMPGLDGLALTREIRRREADTGSPALPIIGLTADVLPEAIERCRKAGMDEVLTKPVTIAELGRGLARWFGSGSQPAPAAVDRGVLAQIVGTDDAVVLGAMLREFVQINATYVADLHDAVNLREAERVRQIAHRIKGSAQTVGAALLAEAAAALERAAQQGQSADLATLYRALCAGFEQVSREISNESA